MHQSRFIFTLIMHNTTEVPSGMSNQQFAYELLHTRGLIQIIDGEQHWLIESPEFTSQSHEMRALYLQASGYITHITAYDLQFEISRIDKDQRLPAPWQTDTNLWVDTFYELVRGNMNIIEGYTLLRKNMIQKQFGNNFGNIS